MLIDLSDELLRDVEKYSLSLNIKKEVFIEQVLKKVLVDNTAGSFFGNGERFDERINGKKIPQENEEKFSTVFRRAPMLMTISNVDDGRYIDVNEKFAEVSGFSREEAIGKTSVELGWLLQEDRRILIQKLHLHGRVKEIELTLFTKDKQPICCIYSGELILFGGDRKLLSIAQDITEHRQAEKILSESEKKYRTLVDTTDTGYVILDLEGKVLDANKEYVRLTGYNTLVEILQRRVTEWTAPYDIPRNAEEIRKCIERGYVRNLEIDYITDQGVRTPIEINAAVLKGSDGITVLTLCRDITERKHTEEALRESEERYRQLVELSPDAILIHVDGKFIFSNIYGALLLGANTPTELYGKTVIDFVHPDYREAVKSRVERLIIKKNQVPMIEEKLIRLDGEIIDVEVAGVPFKYEGKPAVQLVVRDITERKRNERDLKTSEEKYRTLIEQTTDGILVTDLKGNYIDANSGICKMLGFMRDELLSMNMRELSHKDDLKKQSDTLELMLIGENVISERRLLRKDGDYIQTELNAKMLPDGRFCAFVRDITDRKKAELEHLRLQNLESLGILAGGIAHDFNNILTTIMGQASMALLKCEDENIRISLSSILEATKRAVGLTQQLLTFAKGGTPEKTIISIRELIEDTTKFSLSGSNIETEFFFNETMPVEADAGQISQVIQNIVINAKQAMPNGGRVTIKTEDLVDEKERSFLKITIKDGGCGIPNEYLEKIFDPYFTTKQSGSGLGLSVCHSIIKRHGGKVLVNSQGGVGTSFEIYIPGSIQKIEINEKKHHFVTPKLKILIMDDDDTIRLILKEILQELNHSVSETKEGNESISEYQRSIEIDEPYDLIFMDLTIKGGLGGRETVKKLREIDQNVKVIVSSGYADTSISKFKEDGFNAKLNKPYTIEEVNEVIYQVVNN